MVIIESVIPETVCIASKCIKKEQCKRYVKNFPFRNGFNYQAEDYSTNGSVTYNDGGKVSEYHECGDMSETYPRFLEK